MRIALSLVVVGIVAGCGSQGDLRLLHGAAPPPVGGESLAMERVASMELPGWPRNFVLNGDALYVFMNEAGLATIDLSDPAAPRAVEFVRGSGSRIDEGEHHFYDGRLYGDEIVVADRHHGLTLLDVSDRFHPRIAYTVPVTGSQPVGVARIGEDLFVAAGGGGLAWLKGGMAPGAKAELINASHEFVVDLEFYPPHTLLLAHNRSGVMEVMDVTDPGRPRSLHAFAFDSYCDQIVAFDGFAMIAGRARGLLAVDLRDLEHPYLLSNFQASRFNPVRSMTRWGKDRLLVGYSSGSVDCFDLSDPARPLWLGRQPMDAQVNTLAVHEGHLIVGLRRYPADQPGEMADQLEIWKLELNPKSVIRPDPLLIHTDSPRRYRDTEKSPRAQT